jgi:hypothetical protein
MLCYCARCGSSDVIHQGYAPGDRCVTVDGRLAACCRVLCEACRDMTKGDRGSGAWLLCVLVLAIVVAGCGSGAATTRAAHTTAPATTQTSTSAPTPATTSATSTAPPAQTQTTATVKPLRYTVGKEPTTSTGITLEASDHDSGAPEHFRYCIAGPLGPSRCTLVHVGAGSGTASLHIPTPRPGTWKLTVTAPSQHAVNVTRWVPNAGNGKISLLTAGDSEMQIADDYIARDAAPYGTAAHADARQSTGLENEWYYNWFNGIKQDELQWHPQVTVMFMGANDGFGITANGQTAPCCDVAWSRLYAQAVERFSRTLTADDHGVVLWTTLPAPLPATFRTLFDGVNRALVLARRAMPSTIGIVPANAFFTPGNVYRNTMIWHGQTITIHEPDGVHLSAEADVPYAALVMHTLTTDGLLRRH